MRASLFLFACTAMAAPVVKWGDLPLSFEPAAGQTFIARGGVYTLSLTPSEIELRGRGAAPLRMRLSGADPSTRLTGEDRQTSTTNYFTGRDAGQWRTAVPNYSRVRYRNAYPGIDLVYYGNEGNLEYDWIVLLWLPTLTPFRSPSKPAAPASIAAATSSSPSTVASTVTANPASIRHTPATAPPSTPPGLCTAKSPPSASPRTTALARSSSIQSFSTPPIKAAAASTSPTPSPSIPPATPTSPAARALPTSPSPARSSLRYAAPKTPSSSRSTPAAPAASTPLSSAAAVPTKAKASPSIAKATPT